MSSRSLGGALIALAAAWPAMAQQPGDPAVGHELAERLCTSCHIVGTERAGSDMAPPFPAIAKDPAMSLTELHAWSGPMHPVLSNLALTHKQIADINAYLDSLRPGAAAAPLPEQPPPAIESAPPEELGAPIESQPE